MDDKTEMKVAYKHKNAFKNDPKDLIDLHIKKEDILDKIHTCKSIKINQKTPSQPQGGISGLDSHKMQEMTCSGLIENEGFNNPSMWTRPET